MEDKRKAFVFIVKETGEEKIIKAIHIESAIDIARQQYGPKYHVSPPWTFKEEVI